jgi:hypothetical protein
MNYVGEKPTNPLTFMIYPDERGQAATALYEDDGVSPAYKKNISPNANIVSRVGNGARSNSAPRKDITTREGGFCIILNSLPAASRVSLMQSPRCYCE